MRSVESVEEAARLYVGLGFKLISVTAASPLDEAAPAIWRIVVRPTHNECRQEAHQTGVALTVHQCATDVRIARPAKDPYTIDAEFMSVAWALGAWDVARTERMPVPADADPVANGITHHILDPYVLPCILKGRKAAVDAEGWISACKRHGWITWACKPMYGAPEPRQKAWLRKDKTLLPDGSRSPRAMKPAEPVVICSNHQTLIRLGRP